MQEPVSATAMGENPPPYSQLDAATLKNFAAGRASDGTALDGRVNPLAGEYYDHDFRRRYAAILLRERGL